MDDRLVWLLRRFELRSEVFHSGPVHRCIYHDADEGVGHLHLLRHGTLRIESPRARAQTIDQPSVIFYFNPTSHRMLPGKAGADLVCATVSFDAAVGNPLKLALPEVVVLALHDTPALHATLSLLFKEAEESHCGRQTILDRLSEVALVQILRELMDRQVLRIGLLAGLADARLARAINAVHAQPERNWSLVELAREAGMSRARFAAHFRDVVGMTPGAYLSEWRIGVAQSLLRRGKPVNVVADEVGYASASALSRVFTERVGMSPTAWLARLRAAGTPQPARAARESTAPSRRGSP